MTGRRFIYCALIVLAVVLVVHACNHGKAVVVLGGAS